MKTLRATLAALTIAVTPLTTIGVATAQEPTPPSDSVASSVVSVNGNMECSGAMISPSWAITSRYCVDDKEFVTVTTGINQDQGTYTAHVVEHGNTDLALLNIDGVHNGVIATLPTTFSDVGVTGMIIGFGSDNDGDVATTKNAHVHGRFDWRGPEGIVTEGKEQFLHHTQPSGSSLYNSDTGAPLFIGNELHGIVSHGWMDGDTFTETYSASVADNIDWIRMVTGVHGSTWWSMATNNDPGDVYADPDTFYPDTDWESDYRQPSITDTGAWKHVEFPEVNTAHSDTVGV